MENIIIEGNKLIAKFMGYKFKNQTKHWCIYPLDNNSFLRSLGWVEYEKLKFHSEWNWLMPVVEKIKNIGTTSLSTEEEYRLLDNLDDSLIVVRMYLIYEAVIEFIKWYNKQKQ